MRIQVGFVALAAAVVVLGAARAAEASTFTWGCGAGFDISSCLGIVPIDPDVDPNFLPQGSADFTVSGGELTIVLKSESPQEPAIWAALSGLSFDITRTGVGVEGMSAMVSAGSTLVPANGSDIGDQWGFSDSFGFADFGIASVGMINGADADFGGVCVGGPCAQGAPNGVDYSIVGGMFSLGNDGFANANNQPLVQSEVTFVFKVGGKNANQFEMADIANVTPYFGTNGAQLIPEPGPLALFSTGLLVAGLMVRRSGRR